MIVFCQWANTYIRSGLEWGICSQCGFESMTFRKRLCGKSR